MLPLKAFESVALASNKTLNQVHNFAKLIAFTLFKKSMPGVSRFRHLFNSSWLLNHSLELQANYLGTFRSCFSLIYIDLLRKQIDLSQIKRRPLPRIRFALLSDPGNRIHDFRHKIIST